jgi:hypothetical protein
MSYISGKGNKSKFSLRDGNIAVDTDAMVNSRSFKVQIRRARRLVRDGSIEIMPDKKIATG